MYFLCNIGYKRRIKKNYFHFGANPILFVVHLKKVKCDYCLHTCVKLLQLIVNHEGLKCQLNIPFLAVHIDEKLNVMCIFSTALLSVGSSDLFLKNRTVSPIGRVFPLSGK